VGFINTGGQERFRTITSSFYQGADGVIEVYDISNHDSFDSIQKWNQEAERYAPDSIKILVGNKCDRTTERTVSDDEAREFCGKCGMPFFEVSAKEGKNIDELFSTLAIEIIESRDKDT